MMTYEKPLIEFMWDDEESVVCKSGLGGGVDEGDVDFADGFPL